MMIIKFGGTSVGDARRIEGVFNIVTGLSKNKGKGKLGVVVSAMTGVTDDLIKMSRIAASRDDAEPRSFAECFAGGYGPARVTGGNAALSPKWEGLHG